VVEQGTGKSADVKGYLVGGKTGTAEKNGVGGYKAKALLSSFIGAFPMTDPRYVVLVMLDEPKGTKESAGYATGGWVAAPAVSRIVQRIGPMLGVAPVDGDAPSVKKQLFVSTDPKAPRLASY
jgi:cell division protein FtsI (penicillin-binding protein 3)